MKVNLLMSALVSHTSANKIPAWDSHGLCERDKPCPTYPTGPKQGQSKFRHLPESDECARGEYNCLPIKGIYVKVPYYTNAWPKQYAGKFRYMWDDSGNYYSNAATAQNRREALSQCILGHSLDSKGNPRAPKWVLTPQCLKTTFGAGRWGWSGDWFIGWEYHYRKPSHLAKKLCFEKVRFFWPQGTNTPTNTCQQTNNLKNKGWNPEIADNYHKAKQVCEHNQYYVTSERDDCVPFAGPCQLTVKAPDCEEYTFDAGNYDGCDQLDEKWPEGYATLANGECALEGKVVQ